MRTNKQPLDPDILECLRDVIDPEVGLSVVDLGLVYRAVRTPSGLEVALTLTTRACPLGEMIVADSRELLAHRFQDVPSIDVALVWEPMWSPEFITDHGLELLGHPPRKAA
ncbi:metal-sulfur cluster assembly factor [Microvirga brassicacearum]|uniref:Metal-sulfur cluster assembly factor n=1 Tax=Microvirga brassicacearum TaxID=2580413 RepID=A0A5N3PAS9_9HYPH|nr:metal-sulfur cluster assembly factor [Microvirga brassicacearum]KAB0266839.1 metal-sulfur cluster assembly factor [Microvirga brassicacearum]